MSASEADEGAGKRPPDGRSPATLIIGTQPAGSREARKLRCQEGGDALTDAVAAGSLVELQRRLDLAPMDDFERTAPPAERRDHDLDGVVIAFGLDDDDPAAVTARIQLGGDAHLPRVRSRRGAAPAPRLMDSDRPEARAPAVEDGEAGVSATRKDPKGASCIPGLWMF